MQQLHNVCAKLEEVGGAIRLGRVRFASSDGTPTHELRQAILAWAQEYHDARQAADRASAEHVAAAEAEEA